MATPPYITVEFDPPNASDTDSVFDTKAVDTVGKLNPWGSEANDLADWIGNKADQALAAAIGGDLPDIAGKAGEFLRVKSDESGAEFAEVPEPVTQSNATWEAGTSTTEGIVSPAKVAASAEVNSPVKAWVNFDGTGTVSIRESFNVSSITDNGNGSYTVNFNTAVPDANYAVAGSASAGDNAGSEVILFPIDGTFSTSSVGVRTSSGNGSATNRSTVSVTIVR